MVTCLMKPACVLVSLSQIFPTTRYGLRRSATGHGAMWTCFSSQGCHLQTGFVLECCKCILQREWASRRRGRQAGTYCCCGGDGSGALRGRERGQQVCFLACTSVFPFRGAACRLQYVHHGVFFAAVGRNKCRGYHGTDFGAHGAVHRMRSAAPHLASPSQGHN
jgi:hypothetical protein